MLDPTWITTLAADPTFVLSSEPNWLDFAAPAIAAVSACVIAWQALLTRRSLDESRRAVRATEESAKASQEAVTVAYRTLTENQVARLEASAPRIWITAPKAGHDLKAFVDGHLQDVPHGTVYRLPRDAATMVRMTVEVAVQNDGPGSAEVVFSRRVFRLSSGSSASTAVLAPDERFVGVLRVYLTVARWVEIAEAEKAGEEDTLIGDFKVTYTGPRDADIVETHTVLMHNSILKEDEAQSGDWVVGKRNEVSATVGRSSREYWRSQTQRRKFDLS